eukprot:CAMPEP_0170549238 /NCGR_PEP_ID=MMETSP0211-20121228/7427_1 /TAXON_ID=311385 /ORGANISM="Pseudokeronopsis sp., Strain OXSARD2" /LENGTH=109 /DNA_ID=CAMNT_0010855155 /DNA_START=179 /DNA_END=505 /DNA_ORIENTATION=+
MREKTATAVKRGNRLIFQQSKCNCNYHIVFNDEKLFPANKVFNYEEWRKLENYKSILLEEEDYDDIGNYGWYRMHDQFTITISCHFLKMKDVYDVLDNIPHSQRFDVYV